MKTKYLIIFMLVGIITVQIIHSLLLGQIKGRVTSCVEEISQVENQDAD